MAGTDRPSRPVGVAVAGVEVLTGERHYLLRVTDLSVYVNEGADVLLPR